MVKKKVLVSVCILISISSFAQFPFIKWSFDTRDASYGQSAAADIDGDGLLEIVFGCYRNDSCVYALNAEDGSMLWKYNTHPPGYEGCNDVAPVIVDVDGDLSPEIIVPSSCNPTTFCFRGDGSVKWQTPTAGSDSPPTVGNIEGDENPEILHGGFDGHVLCLDAATGAINWSLNVNENSCIQTAPTMVDLDGDEKLDFVVASWAFGTDTSRIYAYRGYDHTLLWQKPVSDVIYHGTAVSDLDQDGKPELVIGSYNGTLYALNGEDGSEFWSYTYSLQSYYYIGAPATIADLDKDGRCEVLFVNMDIAGCLSDSGSLLWHYEIPGFGTAFRGVVVSDINGDDNSDVVFGTSEGNLITLDGTDGSLIWNFDLASHFGKDFELDHAPLIADFDNDSITEVFIVGGHGEYPNFQNDYGRAYMIAGGYGTGPDWLMFQQNHLRQSSLCNDTPVSLPDVAKKNNEKFLVSPNPANDEVLIDVPTAGKEAILEFYSFSGQLIQRIHHEDLNLPINIRNLKSGYYMIRVIGTDVLTGKFLKR